MTKDYSIKYFEEKVEEELCDRRKRDIENYQKHNEYVCLLADNFYGHSDLVILTGFKTIFLEPLFDIEKYLEGQQSKNFDIMLHNKERKQTLFIEVKSSFGSINQLLDDFEMAKSTVKENFDTVLANRVGFKFEEHTCVEFILLIPREQSLQVKERIKSEGRQGIIIWELPTITASSIEIRHEIYSEEEMLRNQQTHKDASLRTRVYEGLKLVRLVKIFNFLLNSDPYQKLTYFVPLFRNLDIKNFSFVEIQNRILDEERCFSAYLNPEKSKEFIYRELINHLSRMKCLKVLKKSESILTNEYELTFDKRVSENILKNHVSNTFFEVFLKEKEIEIKKEALERYQKYHGQSQLFPTN